MASRSPVGMIARVARLVAWGLVWPAAAAAAPSPLREIDHGAITQNVCANVVVHANAAIAASLRADDALARAVRRLRSLGFDEGEFAQRAVIGDVVRLGATAGDLSLHGSEETKRLMALAEGGAPHAEHLRAFADALASALEREHKMSDLLAGLPATLDVRALREAPAGLNAPGNERIASTGFGRVAGRGPGTDVAGSFGGRLPSATAVVRATASDLEARLLEVSKDETRAAARAEGAVTGC